jgi:hypothetical protein
MNYYKYLKLVTGQNIIVTTDVDLIDIEDHDHRHTISIADPIEVILVKVPVGDSYIETFVMRPWLPMSESDVYYLQTKHILLATNLQEYIQKQYIAYMEERKKTKSDEQLQENVFDLANEIVQTFNSNDESDDDDDDIGNQKSIH